MGFGNRTWNALLLAAVLVTALLTPVSRAVAADTTSLTSGGAVDAGGRKVLYYPYDFGATPPSLTVNVTAPSSGDATKMRLALDTTWAAPNSWGPWVDLASTGAVTAPTEQWGDMYLYVQFGDGTGLTGDPIAAADTITVVGKAYMQASPGAILVDGSAPSTDVTIRILGGDSGEYDVEGAAVTLKDSQGAVKAGPATTDATGQATLTLATPAAGTTLFVHASLDGEEMMQSFNSTGVSFVNPATYGAASVSLTGAPGLRVGSVSLRAPDNSYSRTYYYTGFPRDLALPPGTYNAEVHVWDGPDNYLLYHTGVTVTAGQVTAVSMDAATVRDVAVQFGPVSDPAPALGDVMLHPTSWGASKVGLPVSMMSGGLPLKVAPGTYDMRTSVEGVNQVTYSFASGQDLLSGGSVDLRRASAEQATVFLSGRDGGGANGGVAMFFPERWSIGWGADEPTGTTIVMDQGSYPVVYEAEKWGGASNHIRFLPEMLGLSAEVAKNVAVGGPLTFSVTGSGIKPGANATVALQLTEEASTRRVVDSVLNSSYSPVMPILQIQDKNGTVIFNGALPKLGSNTVAIPLGTFEEPYTLTATIDTGDYQGLLTATSQYTTPPLSAGSSRSFEPPSLGTWTFDDTGKEGTFTLTPSAANQAAQGMLAVPADPPAGRDSTNTVTVALPSGVVQALADRGAAVTVSALGAKLALSKEAVADVHKTLDSRHLQIVVGKAPDSLADRLDDARTGGLTPVGGAYLLEVESSGSEGTHAVSLPQHPAQVTLPYSSSSNPAKLGVYRYNEGSGAWDYRGGRVDTEAGTITFTTPSFSEYAVLEYTRSFTDLAGHWARGDVERMAARQIARGVGDGSRFDPNGTITRAQFAALLVRALGLPESQGTSPFTDVAPSAWYAPAVSTAAREGLILGSDGKFRPDAPVTRQEMAVMIQRASAKHGITPAATDQALAQLNEMADGSAVAPWAREAAALTLAKDWIRGRDGGRFAPTENATRAEATVILKRLLTSAGQF